MDWPSFLQEPDFDPWLETPVESVPMDVSDSEGIDELNLALLKAYDMDHIDPEMMVGINPMLLHEFDDSEPEVDEVQEKKEDEIEVIDLTMDDDDDLDVVELDQLWETDSGIVDSPASSSLHSNVTDDDSSDNKVSSNGDGSPSRRIRVDGGSISSEDGWVEGGSTSSEMLQTAPPRPAPHPALQHLPPQQRGFQAHGLMSGMRGVGSGVEGRYQEISSLNFLPPGESTMGHHFSPSYLGHPFHPHPHQPQGHYGSGGGGMSYLDGGRGPLLHNSTLSQLSLSTPAYSGMDIGTTSTLLGPPHPDPPPDQGSSHYNKMENHQEPIYYQGPGGGTVSAELTHHQNETMLSSSFIPDDPFQMMELMNEGMFAMRVMDSPVGPHHHPHLAHLSQSLPSYGGEVTGDERLERISDATNALGASERARTLLEPIMSDGDWPDTDGVGFSQHYNPDKLRGYEYYSKGEGHQRILAPVPQKKHQMFGKRAGQENSSRPLAPPYSPRPTSSHHSNPATALHHASLHFGRPGCDVALNHTYSLPPTHPDHPNMTARTQRPKDTNRSPQKKEHQSRDEKKASLAALPLTPEQIVNLPMDEFNERLSKHELTESQLSLIRDIRRRGKNKVAAQNCRKRKIDQIVQLENEVTVIRQKKESLIREHANLELRRNALKEKYAYLYRHVFQSLRDPDGESYNPEEWALGFGLDGSVRLTRKQSPGTPLNVASSDDNMDDSFFRRPARNPPKAKDDPKKGGGPARS